ncbi:MAG TPA: nuclear transport factor 2 family protein [Vicinamibacterales bacterium]|nr:nuclear transport factor 2 family protein [Vicinamibacterales bacterium]
MDDHTNLAAASHRIASAIAARDTETLSAFLAPGFVYRTPGGDSLDVLAFLNNVRQIPGEVVFVRVQQLQIDVEGDAAIVSGIQHAQLKLDESVVDDVRSFVDFFVRRERGWALRAAVGLPGASDATPPPA